MDEQVKEDYVKGFLEPRQESKFINTKIRNWYFGLSYYLSFDWAKMD
jgi:hypothetical protein